MAQEAQVVKWNCPCGNSYKFHGFTEAPQRKPLMDWEISNVYFDATGQGLRLQDKALAHKFARAIEAAHGIKE